MQRRPQYVQNTVDVVPPCNVSSVYGHPLEVEVLQDIAIAFAVIDTELLGVLEVVLKEGARYTKKFSYPVPLLYGPESQRTVQQDLALISNLKFQLSDIRAGRIGFHEHYLRDRFMLTIWARSSNSLRQMLALSYENVENRPLLDAIASLFRLMERSASPLIDLIPAAVALEVLDAQDRAVIRLRMVKLDDLFDMYHRKVSSTRTMITWHNIRDAIDASKPRTPAKTQRSSQTSITFIFWCTIAATSIMSMPLLVKAYQCSPHKAGTIRDADFWLLLQNSGIQVLNLVTAFIPTYKDPLLSSFARRAMLAMIIWGLLCVIGAIVLYTLAPTEWSAIVSCVGPIIQAFVLVQGLVEKKGKID